jgi:hypothetical protein
MYVPDHTLGGEIGEIKNVTTFQSNYTREWKALEEVRTITKKQWAVFELENNEKLNNDFGQSMQLSLATLKDS